MTILSKSCGKLLCGALRVCFVLLIAIALLSLASPLLGTAASALRRIGGVQVKKGERLADRLPDLARARVKEPYRPTVPEFSSTTDKCLDCGDRATDPAVAFARFDPANRTGGDGVDLYSANIKWSHHLVRLPGRSKLDLGLDLVYNSLVWTKSGRDMWYDADRGFPGPGFQLGFPRIQGPFRQAPDGPASYLLITTSGSRVELAQTAQPDVFESRDESQQQLIASGSKRLALRTSGGTTLSFVSSAGQWQCTRIEDRNGNYLTASYNASGHLQRIEDTAGRIIELVYNAGGNLDRIVQRDASGDKSLATFAYSTARLDPSFSGSVVRGLEHGSDVVVLSQLGLPDGSAYEFQYGDFGQVTRIARKAPDRHVLSTASYEFAVDAARSDIPRPSTIRTWAEALNDGKETLTKLAIDRAAGRGSAILSDGSSLTETFAAAGWQRGLTLQRDERDPNGTSRRIQTAWQQVDVSPTLSRPVKQSQTVWTVDETGTRVATVTEFTSAGLPRDVSHYRNDAFVQRIHTEYVSAPEYDNRHILGLIERHDLYGASGALQSTTSYSYDLPGTIVDQGPILNHNSNVYGPALASGRGLLARITRSASQAPSAGPPPPASTGFKYNTAGSLVEVNDSNGRRAVNSYEDAYSDGLNRRTFAFITSAVTNGRATLTEYDFATGEQVRLENADGEVHTLAYDGAGRLVGRKNLTTGAGARRVFDESGTLITTFSKKPGAKREFTDYKVLDGAGLTRARAEGQTRRAQGYRATVIWRDAKGRRVRSTPPVTVNGQWIAQQDAIVPGAGGKQAALNRVAGQLESIQRQLSATLGRAGEWLQPDLHAQEYCDPDYYGYDPCADNPDNWFYGGEWGYDYYYEWSDVYDALTWGDEFDNPSFWDSTAWAFGQTDPKSAVDWQIWNSGYEDYILSMTWTGKGYEGRMSPGVFDWLKDDPNFANGVLYGMHRDVGDNLRDFRSYSGTFGDGSLQIVMDQHSGRFWIDVDRFNPYQDVVNFFGHAFVEVLPNWFKKVFGGG